MTLKTCITVIVISFFFIDKSSSSECPQTNISCHDINTAEGFTFLHWCPTGSQISVFDLNKTLVAYAVLGTKTTKYADEKIIIGNDSVVTRNCRDVIVKCIVPVGESDVEEICLQYEVTVMPNPDFFPSPTPQNLIIGWAVCWTVFGFGVLMVLIGLLYYWKTKHHVASTVSWFERCPPCTGEINADDFDTTQHNRATKMNEISATDPCGSGESDIQQDNTLESVHVHSIDPTADGEAPQSFSLDHNSNKQEIQPKESGGVIVSDGNGASNHRAVNSLRDDPGGVNDNNRKAIVEIAEMHSGRTVGDRPPEDHGNEGQPLLSNPRAANQGFDMTGQAVALVYEHGFDPDQVSGCSTVPVTDVESTPNMNNEYTYT